VKTREFRQIQLVYLNATLPSRWRAAGTVSDRSWTTQQARWQQENRTQQRKYAVQGDADNPEWQTEQPHKGIGDERQQGQGPAKHKQYAPQKESGHGTPLEEVDGRAGQKVPFT